MDKVLSRYIGTLVGVHIGDSLGAPYETWDAKSIDSDIAMRGGIQFFDYRNPWLKKTTTITPMGKPTDDSDQTCALAQSLIACRGLDQDDLYTRLRTIVYDGVSPLWSGKAFGAGRTTKQTLLPPTFRESYEQIPAQPFGSNGSLMRAAPMALWFGAYKRINDRDIKRMSDVTHRNSLCVEACVFYTRVLVALLSGCEKHTAIRLAYDAMRETELVDVLYEHAMLPKDPGMWPERGLASLSLYLALSALGDSESFKTGLEIAIRFGGDTDTNGAIAGGLLGAYYGYDAIPEAWRTTIFGHDVLYQAATDLYALSH